MAETTTDMDQRLVAQLDFYFGENNLAKDRFLRQHLEATDDNSIELDVVMAFNKMKQLTTDRARVLEAIKSCKHIEPSGDLTRICLKGPLPEPHNVDDRTIYVERLPHKADHDTLRSMFQQFGQITYTSLPRFPDRTIKGFAFIEFSTPEEAEAAAKGSVSYTDASGTHTVKILSKEEWLRLRLQYKRLQRKAQQMLAKKAAAAETRTATATAAGAHQAKTQPQQPQQPQQQQPAAVEIDIPPGTTVRLLNLRRDMRKVDLRNHLARFADVVYVDYQPGNPTGYARFSHANETSKFCSAFVSDPGVQDGELAVTATLLQGEEEQDYIRKAIQVKEQKRAKDMARRQRKQQAHMDGGGAATADSTASGQGQKPAAPQVPAAAQTRERKRKRGATSHKRFDSDDEGQGQGQDEEEGTGPESAHESSHEGSPERSTRTSKRRKMTE